MSPVYFLTVLVAVVGSACFADEGRKVAMGDYHHYWIHMHEKYQYIIYFLHEYFNAQN